MSPKLEKELEAHRENRIKAKALEYLVTEPITFLQGIMNATDQDMRTRADAAKALLPYFHSKKPSETVVEIKEPITAIVRKVI